VWHEFVPQNEEGGIVYLSLLVTADGKNWQPNLRFLDPFAYKGKQTPLFSVLVNKSGTIFIAVATAEKEVTIYSSSDIGRTFKKLALIKAKDIVVVPKLFITSRNEYLLFVTSEFAEKLGIYYSLSTSGTEWTELKALVQVNEGLGLHSIPYHTVFQGKEYVIFQSRLEGKADDYQLFLKISDNGGYSWGRAIQLTTFKEIIDGQELISSQIYNQRPYITPFNNTLSIAWERNRIGHTPQIYYMEINPSGQIILPAEKITRGSSNSYYPQILIYKNRLHLLWFDDSRGIEHIFFANKEGISWRVSDLSPIAGKSRFGRPLMINGVLYVFWENITGNTSRLYLLEPDHSVEPPKIIPVNFPANGEGTLNNLQLRWTQPADSSGIEGFVYSFSRDEKFDMAKGKQVLKDVTADSFSVPSDGTWYFHLVAKDNAGNYSKVNTISFTKDTTPPGRVRFVSLENDNEGFLLSNTIEIQWQPPADKDTAGYSYKLSLLNPDFTGTVYSPSALSPPPRLLLAKEEKAFFENLENGIWAFSVAARDKVGNQGEPQVMIFKLNKHIPVTYITTISSERDNLDRSLLTIYGRGFAVGGLVTEVILDKDGKQPYDYTFHLNEENFIVASDRVIEKLLLDNVEEGQYRVGLVHPTRGLYFTATNELLVESGGTVKYGPYNALYEGAASKHGSVLFFLSLNEVIIWLFILLLGMIFFIIFKNVIVLVSETKTLKLEALAIIQGEEMPMEKAKKLRGLRLKGMGLRIKYTLLITILVILIILMVSIPISFYMIDTQQKTLARKLFENVATDLKFTANGAETYLIARNTSSLSDMIQLIEMDELQFAIITGPLYFDPATGKPDVERGKLDLTSLEHVWAFKDAEIKKRVKSDEEFELIKSEIEDKVTPIIDALRKDINKRAQERISTLNKEIDDLTKQFNALITRTDEDSIDKKKELNKKQLQLITQRDAELKEIGDMVGSFPEYNIENLDLSIDSYTFYKPLVYIDKNHGYDNYVWGIVRIGISMDKIYKEINTARNNLLFRISIITIVAIILGVAGALIMASITIIPIRKLSTGVAVIRDTADKEKLKDHIIDIRTHDEIRELADTVNQMTQGLVKAALANKELTVGKEVQKMFIPLEVDTQGKKRTTGYDANEYLELFGYYEGAKGVSGDYFDFKKLDDVHYAVIKCDVAGKGVPAALIMIEVATIFLTFFREWSLKEPGININRLAYRINDMLEERGFKGRFAALTLCLINSQKGMCHFCNAGDNLIQVFDSRQGKVISWKLPDAPAAGVFPSSLIEMQSGFKQITQQLKKGDTMFLFTDGLHEARRKFRDSEFKVMVCDESSTEDGESHGGTHAKGNDNEELGMKRIGEIIEAVFKKDTYKLFKYHNPIADEELLFDFSRCEGTLDEAVMALVAIEKVFRIYPDPQAGKDDVIQVDKKIDAFIQKYFVQYKYYFKHKQVDKDDPDYTFYTHLKEDDLYDDLTILAVRKK
jgi:serine phosphatase RsbU (regulator of sigma subunit)